MTTSMLNSISLLLSALLGGSLSYLGIVKRYSTKKKYAFRSYWSTALIFLHSFVAILVCAYLQATGVQIIPGIPVTLNYILLALSSAGLSIFILSKIHIQSKKKPNTQSLIEITAWIYDAIEQEMEAKVMQDVADLLSNNPITETDKIYRICITTIRTKYPQGKKRSDCLADIDVMKVNNDSIGMIIYLLDFYDASWIERKLIDLRAQEISNLSSAQTPANQKSAIS